MKVVLLAGGLGTRFSEETALKPKPMIEIGGMPILWHIMKHYAAHGFTDFVICAGYKQEIIKDFFANYHLYKSSVTFDVKANAVRVHDTNAEDWKVTVVDTGLNTLTAGRIKRVRAHIGDAPFFLTYGDGVSDIDIRALLDCHRRMGKALTLSAVLPPARFGALDIEGGVVKSFVEKRPESERLINGGFMVVEPRALDYIEGSGDDMFFERDPMQKIAQAGELAAYEHRGFWQCMDKLHDKNYLEGLWNSGKAPWKVW